MWKKPRSGREPEHTKKTREDDFLNYHFLVKDSLTDGREI